MNDYEKSLLMNDNIKNRLKAMSKNLKFVPRTILDIGAYEGYWSRGIKEIFPSCIPFMIEGDKNKEKILNNIGFPYEIALVADRVKNVTFHKTNSTYTTGNSIYRECTNIFADANPNYYTVEEKTRTLDEIVQTKGLTNIDLIKIDVQGAEKDVILGGIKTVLSSKVVILEISLIEYNRDAPQVLEMITFMDQLGFKLYDIIDFHYHLMNSSLFQFDAMFVHKNRLYS